MIYIVMPAYNAALTIKATVQNIPDKERYDFLVCDDGSQDNTVEVARALGLEVIAHQKNRGYGANQKTLYNTVLRRMNKQPPPILPLRGGQEKEKDIIVMFHPDNQYDGKAISKMVELIETGAADFALGNRMSGRLPQLAGMPWWKQLANRTLTSLQKRVFNVKLGEFHSGLRAYSRQVLQEINFNSFSNDFVFDSEMIAAAIAKGFQLTDAPVQAKYFREASSINFRRSIKYGLETLKVLWRFKRGFYRSETSRESKRES